MEGSPFLTIDETAISINQAVGYLQAAGTFQRFLVDILRQYVLESELKSREDIQAESLKVDQAIMDFRLQNQLTEPDKFQTWLNTNGVTYEGFQQRIAFGFKVEKLKTEVAAPKLEAYFEERKPMLDRVVLSRIILNEAQLAEDLKQQILADRSKFESLARQHSVTEDRVMNGMMGPVTRQQMPDILKTAVDLASPGELIGPLEIDGRYCIFRLEESLPAVLEGRLMHDLKNQLFDRWLQERLQSMKIQLNLNTAQGDTAPEETPQES